MFVCACAFAYAQTDTIRYVHPNGAYNNDGKSWATAKNRVQDAINDLKEYLADNSLTSGSVYIAAGTYVPTESTETSGGSMLNTSFKIYAGIHVYGGFNPVDPEEKPGDRIMLNGKTVSENWSDPNGIGTTSGTEIASQWDLRHKTILTGNHSGSAPTFVFDSIRGRYNTAYPASSYHVVWFATNGKYTALDMDDALKDHFKPLAHPASIDGCVISSGNASSRSTTTREHTAYGGGVYMVGNSSMRACTIERCSATMRGGGIYCDGGGNIEFCYILACQATGVGVVEGYGGGVCIDHEGSIGHSQISCCAARCGGGLMISHVSDEYPWALRVAEHVLGANDTITSNYSPYSTACVINNNTANAEGGGIYLSEGGTVNHATVCGNNCSGPDVTYYGRRHGRTGGIYIRNCGLIFNSVFWGNRCDANNDIQFASVRQKSGVEATGFEILAYHTAFMNHDITDWTGVKKDKVFTLDRSNMPIQSSSANHPCFFQPTVDPNNWDSVNNEIGMYGAGVLMHMYPVQFPGPRIWHLTSYSALDQKGVQWNESVQDASPWLIHSHTDYGVVSNPYEPVSTLGALVRKPDPLTYELIVPQSAEYTKSQTPIPTLFVDPNRAGVYDEDGNFVPQPKEGDSWNVPIKDLGEALSFFRRFLVDDEDNRENHHYMIPALDEDGRPTGEPTRYDYVQILVKEGTLTTVGPGNYLDRNIRTAAIRMESHMRMYGGYPSTLTGTNTEGRNPRKYKSTITANITGKTGDEGYHNNSAHVIAMVNCEHTIVDGFTLSDANTHNVYISNSAKAGGGLLLNNASTLPEERIDMAGNQLRNSVISNCTSPKGAAVYVNGEWPKANGEICYAELMLVNCVVRNNTADYSIEEGDYVNDHGIITANGRAYVHAEHCTVVNNVGYPFKAESKDIETDEPVHCEHPEHASWPPFHGYIRVDNSIVFCNSDRSVEDHSNLSEVANVLSVNPDGQDHVFGKYNMFDADIVLHKADVHKPSGFFANDYEVPISDHFLPDGISSHFTDDISDIPADSAARDNKCIFTRTDNTEPTFPVFVNPSRNVGHSTSGDKPLYGGVVAYDPLTTNPCVNAAGRDEYTVYYDYDRSDVTHRDHGGAPDVGAIENTDLPAAGTVIYVTPDGAGKRDGSSWANAIAGNTVYVLNDIAGPALAEGDQIDPELTCDRVLDNEGNPILTTNEKYNGGWGRVWFTGKTTGGTSTTTVTNLWTTEKEIYTGGPDDRIVIPKDNEHSVDSVTVTNSTGSTPGGWSAGWEYDPRYPYGEISGASRSFWRANPYTGNSSTYGSYTAFITACNAGGWINNTRAERYVGGLQYAVEKASAANKTYHSDSVQVWVGAGTYNDYKGFVMRDSVTVLGGFPATKYKAPGMSERQALMSDVISIPKSKPAEKLNAADYESVLQISEVNPKSSNTALNTDAVKYWDNDYKVDESTETRNYEYKKRVVTTTYTYLPPHLDTTEVTSTYIKYANMTGSNASKSIIVSDATNEGVTDGRQYYRFGAPDEAPNRKDCWHMSHPSIENYIANLEDNNTYNNYCSKTIFDSTGTNIGESARMNWIMIGNGSLTDLNIWQTMPDVSAGQYLLSIDMACQYKNKFNASEDLNAYFYVLNSNNDTLARTALKAPKYSTRDNSRKRAFRHVLAFTTDSPGDVTIKLVVGDGFRNTKANNATYGTVSGGDTIPIPCYYVGRYGSCNDKDKWGTNNPNARELWLSNVHLEKIVSVSTGYAPSDPVVVTTDTLVDDPQGTKVINTQNYTATKERSTLRKRVLTMPDVCVPTYGGGGIGDPVSMDKSFGDNLPHSDRVTGSTRDKRTATTLTKQSDPAYVEYNEVNWDGFTIRHGFLYDESMAHGGGSGVNMYEGAHLRNCIVTNNFSGSRNMKGGGIFCDGATSTIEGCFVLNNTSTHGTKKDAQIQIFAGGMFMYEGTCFNSLFANNYSNGSAGGVGFCVGKFFNNTIAYNSCDLEEGSPKHKNGGAISIATSSNPNLFVANTIIYGNEGMAIRERYDREIKMDQINPFINCYVQNEVAFTQSLYKKNIGNHSDNDENFGVHNILLDGVTPSANNTPFAADFVNGVYTPGNASANNDFRLLNHAKMDSSCVNHGTEEFAIDFKQALMYKGKTSAQVDAMPIYQSVDTAQLPQNDVAFAKRVQDCQIDIGAYEFNAAYSIKPDTTTHPGLAIFYVTFDAHGGDASAVSPENAACKQKLQLVLDAAGRYKNNLMTLPMYNKGEAGTYVKDQPNKHWSVEVWLEGDSEGSTTTNTYADWYTPTRSTKHSDDTYQDNTLDYSFIMPRGVHLMGGFKDNFYHYEDAEGNTVAAGTTGAHIVDDRDPLTYRTVLSGEITSSTGAIGQCYHVVTFTNDLFTPEDEKYYKDGEGKTIRDQLAAFTDEKDRAVLDGLFLMNGKANAPDDEHKNGGACIVTDYAHVRNCVIQNNSADNFGGGLYLKPRALVSGCIVKNNSANTGGGIYVERPTDAQIATDSLARVFYSTICENTGHASAGGLFFDNTYARINSSAIWHNNANDNANVAGNFTRSDDTEPYPMNCCAVESRRLEGQGNIELSPRETEGVRWDREDPFDALLYYPIEMSSTLARAGISYTEWDNFYATFATLDSIDIAGVSRKRWMSDGSVRGYAWGSGPGDTLVTKNNDVIDIGARAVNKNFEVHVDSRYVMHRLFVVHTELIDSKAARALQDNSSTDSVANMYRQMGSCIYNPYHRLDDAFEYIIKARKMDSVRYRNTRFEIFIEQGTYYPIHDAYLRQGTVRMNTFLVPEAVLIVGGVDSRPADHKYGQDGFSSPFSTVHMMGNPAIPLVTIPGTEYKINFALTDSIRLRDERHRPMRDNNLNSVIEPWELERQTILSGNAVSGEDFTHIYHVVTCHADNRYIGPRPLKYRTADLEGFKKEGKPALTNPIGDKDQDHWEEECDLSILARTIGFDGVQITGGYANHVDTVDTVDVFVTKTYFRGGGIYVDGNWTEWAGRNPPDMTQPALHNIPIVVENCFFTNNMAGNGGAIYSNGGIYAYGNRFTQNYSQGPMTKLDQRYIPWTAGGCIATNAFCGVSNTLFDNNEARRGLYPLTAVSADPIPDADARQGFGGCLSVAAQSTMRAVNCHFVKNKAVAYSAIYNFKPNSHYVGDATHLRSDSMQFAFNTLFWGNEVFDIPEDQDLDYLDHKEAPSQDQIDAFNNKYRASRAGVFHYDGDEWDKYEKLYHEYDSIYRYWTSSERPLVQQTPFHPTALAKLAELRAQGNKMEGLYFCSYRKGYGPTGMKPTQDGYLLTEEEYNDWKDPRGRMVTTKTDDNNDKVEDYTDLWTQVGGNNNVLINQLNTATDGPNFKQPTFVAGIDGYMQNADWLLARMNHTTDQGWGHLRQSVTRGVAYYITRYTGSEQFKTAEEALAAAQDAHPGATNEDVFPVSGLPIASFLDKGDQPDPGAMYNFLAWRYGRMMSESNAPLPLRDQYYMNYTRSSSDSEMGGNMDRISKHPKMGETDVYIDIGIYEYQYVQLDIKGQEIDTVWVATKAKDPLKQDGLTWETPTTDLQTAIDILMSSHNNHDKYICLMGDDEGGTFSPQNVIDNRRAYIISSNTLAPLMPDSAEADHDYGVNSLTFLGGYSFDVKDAPRDPQAHPTIIEMPNTGTMAQRNQLFVIEDMTRQMVQANWQGEYTSRDSVVIPIVFDGITFINPYSTKEPDSTSYSSLGGQMSKKGGAAIYYRWQRRYEGNEGVYTPNFNMALHPDSALIDGNKVTLPKLTISNCIFMDNGARTVNKFERSPAVRIDHGGGSSLIVNTLFHSNAGAPVYARTFDITEEENDLAKVPNDVIMVNITSALNDGHIRLDSKDSEVHNSLIWLDDLGNDTTVQLQMGTATPGTYDQWDKTTNKDRDGIAGRMTHNAIWGCFQAYDDNPDGDPVGNNHPLSKDNNNILKGPGFVSPHVNATTSEQRRERSFRLNPSVRTHGMANKETYLNRVFFRVYPDTCDATHNKYWRRSNGFKLLTFTNAVEELANDSDLAAKPRLSGNEMERGAYECLAVLQRVLYVDPVKPAVSAGDGSNWMNSFGQGQLQNAIDAAAVYTYLYQNETRETRKAYVFVKGTGESIEPDIIEARDGVYVFGSLPVSFQDTAFLNEGKFEDSECTRYVNYVRSIVSGVASENANRSKIHAIHVTGDDFDTGFLLDGFMITNPTTRPDKAAVLLDNEMSAVRNCIIVDNHVINHPVADVQRGLLYNCLFYNDSAQTIVKVGENGLVLNNTIVANNNDVTPLDDSEATPGAVVNNISGQLTNLTCFAPYMTEHNPYTLPVYLTDYTPLSFQLHEHSTLINDGTDDGSLSPLFNIYKTDNIINFNRDRDILGNPRKISTSVDKGALETWRVEKNNTQVITALTNKLINKEESTDATPERRLAAFSENYGGNRYPHPGSVVYLMDSAAMTMQYETPNDFHELKNASNPIALRPGFMLLKPGASFYGNGHNVQMAYVAAEKKLTGQRYTMTSFPFDYDTTNITVTAYDAEKDSLIHQHSPFTFTTYQYNGIARSDKDYIFQPENSTLWTQIDATNRIATDGYLMDFGAAKDTVLRFNAFAPSGQYVYAENGSNKTVTLLQHDHREAGSGESLNFTRQEDMGWNMKGLPWLVSDYRTDTLLDAYGFIRQMHIPHVLYMMDGAGEYLKAGGQVYSARSWDQPTCLSMGSAFLTQTATTQDSETVTFYQPYYGRNDKKLARPFLLMTYDQMVNDQMVNSSDLLTVFADSTASADIQYTYGRDAIKWDTNDSTAQVYLLDSKRLSRLSILGAAPTEVDIPLGVYIPITNNLSPITFTLPEKDAFADFDYVWFIDYQRNRYTNLLDEDYEIELGGGEHHHRFAIRIGGYPKGDKNGERQYIVYTSDGNLYVRGIIPGDRISVYTPTGMLVHSTIANANEFILPLFHQSGFLVRVNDSAYKVVNW